MDQYCPDCISLLKRQSKKLGEFSVWLVCPNCGHRERPIVDETTQTGHSIDRIKQRNKNLNQFNYNT